MTGPKTFTAATIAEIVGVPLRDEARVMAGLPALVATQVSPERHTAILAEIDEKIYRRDFRVIGEGDDHAIWTKGWGAVSEQISAADKITLETLKPQYFHHGEELRLLGDYWTPQTEYFEYYLGIAVRRLLMLHNFADASHVLELGCGTGMNIVLAAELFPNAALFGTDWVQPSIDILDTMAGKLDRDIKGALFDMLTGKGGDALPIGSDTDVMTVHALEQLGAAAPVVIELLLKKRPRRVLHIEPILEFYDRKNKFDDIAARYHFTRGYLQSLEPVLKAHAFHGKIEILSEGRVQLGNRYHEAYSYISWRPIP